MFNLFIFLHNSQAHVLKVFFVATKNPFACVVYSVFFSVAAAICVFFLTTRVCTSGNSFAYICNVWVWMGVWGCVCVCVWVCLALYLKLSWLKSPPRMLYPVRRIRNTFALRVYTYIYVYSDRIVSMVATLQCKTSLNWNYASHRHRLYTLTF